MNSSEGRRSQLPSPQIMLFLHHGFHPGRLAVASQRIFQARCLTARLPARLPAVSGSSIPSRSWIRPGPSDKCDKSWAGLGASLLVASMSTKNVCRPMCPPVPTNDVLELLAERRISDKGRHFSRPPFPPQNLRFCLPPSAFHGA